MIATGYSTVGGEIDVSAALATHQRNSTPQGHLFIEGVGILPRVSAILDQLAKPGLEKWKERQLRQLYERAADRVGDEPRRLTFGQRFRLELGKAEEAKRRDNSTASTLGTAFHGYAEQRSKEMMGVGGLAVHVAFDSAVDSPVPSAIEPAIEAWERWVVEVGYRPLLVEHRCWCTDASCGYTGSLDAVAEVNGLVTLCDWKRARSIYDTYSLQVAAYDHLLTRTTGLVVDQLMIVKVPQDEPGDVEVRIVPRAEIPLHYEAFNNLLSLWRWSRRTVEDRSDATTTLRRLAIGQASHYMELSL